MFLKMDFKILQMNVTLRYEKRKEGGLCAMLIIVFKVISV